MKLERIEINALKEGDNFKKAIDESHKYGVYRGEASASGDKYAMFGGPKFDDVLRDYLTKKFGAEKDLQSIAALLSEIPQNLIDKLREGFDEGYSEESRNLMGKDTYY